MNKVEKLVKCLERKDVFSPLENVFCSTIELDEGNKAEFLEKLNQLKDGAFAVKGREIVNIVDNIGDDLVNKIKKENKMDNNFIIRITDVYERGYLRFNLYDAGDKNKLMKENVPTKFATNDMNKVEKLVKYLNSNPKKLSESSTNVEKGIISANI